MTEGVKLPLYSRGRLVAMATIDDDRADEFLTYLWCLSGGYACRGLREGETVSRTMHRQVCGLANGDPRVVHHINEDKLDNRLANLEVCETMSIANGRPHPKRDDAGRVGFAAYLVRAGLGSRS